jgi:hypothetical protein
LDGVELIQINLNAGFHLPQGGDGSVGAIVCQKGQLLLVCIFDLHKGMVSVAHV